MAIWELMLYAHPQDVDKDANGDIVKLRGAAQQYVTKLFDIEMDYRKDAKASMAKERLGILSAELKHTSAVRDLQGVLSNNDARAAAAASGALSQFASAVVRSETDLTKARGTYNLAAVVAMRAAYSRVGGAQPEVGWDKLIGALQGPEGGMVGTTGTALSAVLNDAIGTLAPDVFAAYSSEESPEAAAKIVLGTISSETIKNDLRPLLVQAKHQEMQWRGQQNRLSTIKQHLFSVVDNPNIDNAAEFDKLNEELKSYDADVVAKLTATPEAKAAEEQTVLTQDQQLAALQAEREKAQRDLASLPMPAQAEQDSFRKRMAAIVSDPHFQWQAERYGLTVGRAEIDEKTGEVTYYSPGKDDMKAVRRFAAMAKRGGAPRIPSFTSEMVTVKAPVPDAAAYALPAVEPGGGGGSDVGSESTTGGAQFAYVEEKPNVITGGPRRRYLRPEELAEMAKAPSMDKAVSVATVNGAQFVRQADGTMSFRVPEEAADGTSAWGAWQMYDPERHAALADALPGAEDWQVAMAQDDKGPRLATWEETMGDAPEVSTVPMAEVAMGKELPDTVKFTAEPPTRTVTGAVKRPHADDRPGTWRVVDPEGNEELFGADAQVQVFKEPGPGLVKKIEVAWNAKHGGAAYRDRPHPGGPLTQAGEAEGMAAAPTGTEGYAAAAEAARAASAGTRSKFGAALSGIRARESEKKARLGSILSERDQRNKDWAASLGGTDTSAAATTGDAVAPTKRTGESARDVGEAQKAAEVADTEAHREYPPTVTPPMPPRGKVTVRPEAGAR